MKKHLSVFGLWVKCSFYKIACLIAIMSIVEYMLFSISLKNEIKAYEITRNFSRPEFIFDRSGAFVCFGVAFIVITLLLSIYGCQFSCKTSYTLQRLRINEKYVFLYQGLYNLMVYVLLWFVQLLLCIFMMNNYIMQAPEEFWDTQSIFLAFYRSTRLHSIIPLSDGILWARNVLLLVMLALSSAEFPYLQRRGKKSATVIALSLYTVALWKQDIAPVASLVSTVFIAIAVFSSVAYQIFFKEDTGVESEDNNY